MSLAWGIASYAKVMRDARDDKARINRVGFALQAVWRAGTMISRVVALLCCASVIQTWFLLAISIHWLMMTFWTVKQKTDLCTTAWEERIYNAIVGVVYCFDFFNLKVQNKTIHRLNKLHYFLWRNSVGRAISAARRGFLHNHSNRKCWLFGSISSIF
jgi:hypothetical protein